MKTVIPALYASPPEAVPFGPALDIRAFLLQREQGNLLVYRADTLREQVAAVNDLGGISRQYLNHRHEAAPACDWVAETFGAPLYCHVDDAGSASAGCKVVQTFSERHRVDDDFEVIPTPGHTSGATAYLWDTGQHRCLFTGDTIFLSQRRVARALAPLRRAGTARRRQRPRAVPREPQADPRPRLRSPRALPRDQRPAHYEFVDKADAEGRIDTIIERVRRGENG